MQKNSRNESYSSVEDRLAFMAFIIAVGLIVLYLY
jgi:hypothetical protein